MSYRLTASIRWVSLGGDIGDVILSFLTLDEVISAFRREDVKYLPSEVTTCFTAVAPARRASENRHCS